MPALPTRIRLADVLELGGLHPIRDRELLHPPRLPAFLQGGVVQVAVVAQQPGRPALLRTGGVGAEFVGSSHLIWFLWSAWVTAREVAALAGAFVPILRPGSDIPGQASSVRVGQRQSLFREEQHVQRATRPPGRTQREPPPRSRACSRRTTTPASVLPQDLRPGA